MIVFLIGFMGSGKSHWGKLLANALNYSFIDTDLEIANTAQQSITDIFSVKGETHFRELEKKWLAEFDKPNTIVAVGGGMPIYSSNIEVMYSKGKVVFIDQAFDIMYNRISKDSSRPFVMQKSKEALHQLYIERLPIYKKAHIIIESPIEINDFLTKLNVQ